MDHPEIKQLIADYIQSLLIGNKKNSFIDQIYFVHNLFVYIVLILSICQFLISETYRRHIFHDTTF